MLRRIATNTGAVVVWAPEALTSLEVVVYVHGFYDTVDTAMHRYGLASQFAESGVDATFVVCEAPTNGRDPVAFPYLGELLKLTGQEHADQITVIGHSGAHRTIRCWLEDERITHLILLDVLYGGYRDFLRWGGREGHTMQLVGYDTAIRSKRLAAELGADSATYTEGFGHMEIVHEGLLIPGLLELAPGLSQLPEFT